MLNKDKTINIICYDVSGMEKHICLEMSFQCNKCKNLQDCKDVKKCRFVNYIRQRIPKSKYNYNLENPVLKMLFFNPDDYMKIVRTIISAKKMRMAGKQK